MDKIRGKERVFGFMTIRMTPDRPQRRPSCLCRTSLALVSAKGASRFKTACVSSPSLDRRPHMNIKCNLEVWVDTSLEDRPLYQSYGGRPHHRRPSAIGTQQHDKTRRRNAIRDNPCGGLQAILFPIMVSIAHCLPS